MNTPFDTHPHDHDPFDRHDRRQRGPRRGGPHQRGGRRRGRRGGDVRAAALLLLAEQPRHGYDLIQEIRERSNEMWTPSPGSVYPVLQQLEDEGLVEFERVDGRKTASLTAAGRTFVEDNADELGTPWATAQAGSEGVHELGHALRSLMGAFRQVTSDGTPEQRRQAAALLDDTRRQLYRVLAGDES
ncbi:PadR family transcriptional regulator [Aeromicrobium sp. Leaf350]|uniref:PadR family transcriptional regulator n=1 Tax=Aeromicrobium sp. Leaf350 TaxID=2876565 RepID=UPI001E3134F2|nr:PadR family transcriptional regulator [Aeromicrobium sp. Leaf350]